MDLNELIEKYIIPISKVATLLSVIVGIFLAYGQYRLKVRSEIRLRDSAEAENDIKLINLFSETFETAHARNSSLASEKILEKLFDKNFITIADLGNSQILEQKLRIATIILPVGRASQEAAIAAIADLGIKYKVLRQAALTGLLSLKSQNIPLQIIDDSINKINSVK